MRGIYGLVSFNGEVDIPSKPYFIVYEFVLLFFFLFLVFEIPLRFYPTFFHPFTPSLPSSIHFRVFLFVFIKCVVMWIKRDVVSERPLSRWPCLWRFSPFSSVVWRLISSFSFIFFFFASNSLRLFSMDYI